VWFKLPRGAINATTQGRIDRNGVLLYFGLGGGDLQIGYLIRSGEWPSIRQAGFDAFRERVAEIDPRVGSTMAVQLDGFRDTSLLDVAPGIADSWSRDGLLIGDAAHTASPIGAQGNPLAVEDAVVAHSLLVENSLARTEFSNAKPSTNSRFDDVRTSNRLFRSSGAPRPISRTGSSTVAMSLHASFVVG